MTALRRAPFAAPVVPYGGVASGAVVSGCGRRRTSVNALVSEADAMPAATTTCTPGERRR